MEGRVRYCGQAGPWKIEGFGSRPVGEVGSRSRLGRLDVQWKSEDEDVELSRRCGGSSGGVLRKQCGDVEEAVQGLKSGLTVKLVRQGSRSRWRMLR